ncbi:hypothetical protein P9273_18895 [Mesorhizobium sp. WSM4935]|uniref:hypothetical protein n=1 Tax=Mesorhizobium sp. WSM4935 TaxID=3038547 RepID=UPI0024157B70|nr:hypothetical protein [Mesorhizobium sp. WSM4935]MDG4877166.1 hypothetical protein [Mesorhizobium sp. WSM4935]
MAGKTTHDQQQRIIEERVNTKNAGKDFNAEEELKRPHQERAARAKGSTLKPAESDLVDSDDRQMLRGENQESPHRKRRSE